MTPTLVCDLDGVVYLGETAVPGSAAALREAVGAGWSLIFATNNSARRPADVVAKLSRVAGFEADESQIVTSSMVAASLVRAGPVLMIGEDGLAHALAERSLDVTEDPGKARAVVVGLDREIDYSRIHRAALAVRGGAQFIATNRDPTFPTDRGLFPGAGACVAAVETAAGQVAETAGKPTAAMRSFIEVRSGSGPIWMVGDRPDTDLALADGPRWHTALVLTGVTVPGAPVEPAPDLVAPDLPAALGHILAAAE